MVAATATSRSCGSLSSLATIIVLIGFSFTLAQDHRFRINVYDDYDQQQPVQHQNYRDERYQDDYQDQYEPQQHEQPPPRYQQQPQSQYQQHPQSQYQQKHRSQYQQQVQPQYQQQHESRYENPIVQYQKPISQYQKPVSQHQKSVAPKKKPKKDGQDFSKIPGIPGVDFPIYHTIPKTSFACSQVPYLPGMYANVETGCQVYHVCHDGREGEQGAAFLCSNGTLFNQKEFACDWWYNVNCANAFNGYKLNGDATTNPFVPKAKQEEILRDRLKIVVF